MNETQKIQKSENLKHLAVQHVIQSLREPVHTYDFLTERKSQKVSMST